MAASGLDLRAVEARNDAIDAYSNDVAALLAHCRALREALVDDPFGDGLVEVLERAKAMLWAAADDAAPQVRDDLRELGRILSGRAVRIQERVAALLGAAQDGEGPEGTDKVSPS